MYRKIMVPTEGTGFDREAIKVALRLAEKSDAEVHLVRVAKPAPLSVAGGGIDGVVVAAEAISTLRDRELSDLYMLAAECRDTTSATIVTSLEEGAIADVLEGYAARTSPDLIVISSHGRHGIARLSLGSVTDALIRHAHVPVLVVKPAPSYLNPQAVDRFRRMVIPLDGSTLAEQILESAVQLASVEQAEIIFLQVLSPDERSLPEDPLHAWWEDEVPSAHAYLARIAGRVRRLGLSVTTDIVIGSSVAEAIATFARSSRADTIALATHGRSGLRRAIRGSVADELTRSSSTSLLVLHPQQYAADRDSPSRGLAVAEA